MGLGKHFTDALITTKSTEEAFDIAKDAIMQVSKCKIKVAEFNNGHFFIHSSEKVNWLSTNWPTIIKIHSETLNEETIIAVEVYSNGTSITQSGNTKKKLSLLVDILRREL